MILKRRVRGGICMKIESWNERQMIERIERVEGRCVPLSIPFTFTLKHPWYSNREWFHQRDSVCNSSLTPSSYSLLLSPSCFHCIKCGWEGKKEWKIKIPLHLLTTIPNTHCKTGHDDERGILTHSPSWTPFPKKLVVAENNQFSFSVSPSFDPDSRITWLLPSSFPLISTHFSFHPESRSWLPLENMSWNVRKRREKF